MIEHLRQYLALFVEEAVPVPPHAIGRIIGKGGSTIDRLRAIEGMQRVSFPKAEDSVLLYGTPKGLAAAKAEVPRGAQRGVWAEASETLQIQTTLLESTV